jgi:flagellar motor switch protein FliG
MANRSNPGALSGAHKAAVLLILVGEEVAAAVYKNLPESDLQRITQEIAELGAVTAQHANEVLEEYSQLALTKEYLARGGRDYATKLLIKAFGEKGAQNLLEQVSRMQEIGAGKLDSLQKADPQQLSKFLEGEHPQTIALILAHLDARQGTELLRKLPEQTRAEAVKRLAQLRQFSPEIAQKLSMALHKRLQALGEQSRRTYAGLKGVADLLNRLDPNTSKGILQSIEQDDPKLAIGVRNLMFTFEDLLSVPEASLRELVSQLDKKTVALALKGASEELKMRVFKCMSSRAVEMLKEDMDALGLVRTRDIAKAQQDAVAQARQLESEGKIVLKMEGEDEYVT